MADRTQKHILIPVNLSADQINWKLLELFRRRFSILWDNLNDLELKNLTATIHKKNDGTYEGVSTLPNIHRLKGFYTDYRHFYLEKEKTNIFRIMKYLCSITDSVDYKRFIRNEKNKFKSNTIENNWLKIDDKILHTKEVLNLWFNGEIFHNDEKIMERLAGVRKSMTPNLWKYIVFMAVYDTPLIIRNIHWSQRELSQDNLYLLMPYKKRYRL